MLKIQSPRLVLVAATAKLAKAEAEGGQRLATLLGASVSPEWPPPLNDEQSMNWMVEFLDANPDSVGWALWYFLCPDADGRLMAVGNGGFKGTPSSDGMVEVGYSIMEKYQCKGYATEAVTALVDWAFSKPDVCRVIAHTLPDLTPSIRVLEKCDFAFVGDGPEEGVILYERRNV
ncbi:MAG: GNAT family N-acetyltransferase [Woeseiaceae bacterium]|nr:GNAT family N-acetyltransferase [Woeseiaceae bacterium]